MIAKHIELVSMLEYFMRRKITIIWPSKKNWQNVCKKPSILHRCLHSIPHFLLSVLFYLLITATAKEHPILGYQNIQYKETWITEAVEHSDEIFNFSKWNLCWVCSHHCILMKVVSWLNGNWTKNCIFSQPSLKFINKIFSRSFRPHPQFLLRYFTYYQLPSWFILIQPATVCRHKSAKSKKKKKFLN